jgi:hypothetical protein
MLEKANRIDASGSLVNKSRLTVKHPTISTSHMELVPPRETLLTPLFNLGLIKCKIKVIFVNSSFDISSSFLAFLNVDKTYQQGNDGILGLGFISLSMIQKKIKTKVARPIMANLFDQNPSTTNFMALALERTTDNENTSGGAITIGQYDPRFKDVSGTPKYALAPSTSSRWTIALSGMKVNGHDVTLKSAVKGAKKGTAISLIDSGTSLAYIPSYAVDAIYGAISGSVHIQNKGQNFWIVPCLGQANLSFSFGSVIPILFSFFLESTD